MMANSLLLRKLLQEAGFEVLGNPSAIVPVVVGDSTKARYLTNEVIRRGAILNFVEHPAVSKNSSRWRLQVMADHTEDDIRQFVKIAVAARDHLSGTSERTPELAL